MFIQGQQAVDRVRRYPGGMELDKAELGRALRDLRTSAGLSLRAIGELVGTNFSNISLYESGKRDSGISLEMLKKILDAIGAGLTLTIHPKDPGSALRVEPRRDPLLDDLAAALPQLDDVGREIVQRALRLALPTATERDAASREKKLA